MSGVATITSVTEGPEVQLSGGPALDLIRDLCKTLAAENINYCHWKSNAALDRSASGQNDLDLLVDRADSQAFLAILFRLGFKETQSPNEDVMPGVHNYYGYDPSADRIVNVHVHFQLILGHDFTKNFHLPIERAYLQSAVQGELFRVPAPEFELIVLVIRLAIKHFTWDAFLLGHSRLSSAEKGELEYLLARISESRLDQILAEHFDLIDPGLFHAGLRRMVSPGALLERLRTGQRLVDTLAPYARHSWLSDAALKIFRRVSIPVRRRILRKDGRKRMRNGGLLVAVVGGDGAGKTTVVDGLCSWLGEEFAVRKIHMGKPGWSALTIAVRGVLKIGRTVGLYPFQRSEIRYTADADLLDFPGYPWLIREVCTARDRYLSYRKARRCATHGEVVILDRFPLAQIQFMDGPQVARMTRKIRSNRLVRWLARLEEGYYQKMALPDLLMVLRVNPEIAVHRKSDESAQDVRARSNEVWGLDWGGTTAHVIDASRSKSAVLAEVKALVWSWL